MNYLKKYRQDAGLTRTNENATHSGHENIYGDHTPTKETLDYLSGMLRN